ncbi:O-antigen ligase family protein [Wansuia hejianensis]|uniref:O-antigen ligase family protein n=1 Tax=Wansuia hejianensis TaxID=2763667 RepID=A0A7G9GDB2_9FIRM|nr:O-antigen ligase family protein [Wansuia hejianensis]QNM08794.1 O-antigen ligase family protein [Wansuia hejianensis]
MEVRFRNIYIVLISAVLAVLGTLAARGSVSISVIPVPYMYAVIMIIFVIGFYKNPFIIPVNKKFLLLIGICALSAAFNSDTKMIVSCFCMLVIFSYLLKASEELRIYLLLGTALGQFVFLFRYGLIDSWNGNSVCTALAFVTMIALLSYLTNISDLAILLITFVAGVIVIIMSSRTSIIAFFVSMLCLFIIRYRKKSSWPVKLTVLIALLLIFIVRFRDKLSLVLFNKWSSRGYEGVSILTGRGYIWVNELKNDWTWLGNGESYFDSIYHHNDAHNIFIQVLGRYGTIVLILFIVFAASLIIWSFKMKNDSKMYILPIVVAYFITGLFENVLFIDCKMYIPSILILIIAATLINDKNSAVEEVNASDL